MWDPSLRGMLMWDPPLRGVLMYAPRLRPVRLSRPIRMELAPKTVDTALRRESRGFSRMGSSPTDKLQVRVSCRCRPPWLRRQWKRRSLDAADALICGPVVQRPPRRQRSVARRHTQPLASPLHQRRERRFASCLRQPRICWSGAAAPPQGITSHAYETPATLLMGTSVRWSRSGPGPQTANAERHHHSAFTCGLTWHAGALSPLSHARDRPTSARIEQRRRACRGKLTMRTTADLLYLRRPHFPRLFPRT